MKTNYNLVLELVMTYEGEADILDKFNARFEKNKNIRRNDFYSFFESIIDDMSEMDFIHMGWRFVESGGDWSEFDND